MKKEICEFCGKEKVIHQIHPSPGQGYPEAINFLICADKNCEEKEQLKFQKEYKDGKIFGGIGKDFNQNKKA